MPGEIDSNRLRAILGSSTHRRYAPAPKTLSRLVEQEFSSGFGARLREKGTLFGSPFLLVARPERFELPTARFVVR